MRRFLQAPWVVGAGAVALTLTACGSGTSDEAGSGSGDRENRIVKVGNEPQNPLIPSNTTEVGGGEVISALFTGLVNYNVDTAKPENAMAESITPNADNTVYTVKLKTGWKFHDGTDVKAKNFVDAWNWASYGPNAQSTSYFFDPIDGWTDVQSPDTDDEGNPVGTPKAKTMKGLKTLDDSSFEVKLSAPNSTFITRLGYTAFSPLPDSFFGGPDAVKAFEGKPIGNGPFMYDSREVGTSITLKRYPDYLGPDKPSIDGVEFRSYTNLGTAFSDVVNGEADVLDQVPPEKLAGGAWKNELDTRWIEKPQGSIQTITPPTYVDGYANQKFIQAVSRAVNREEITKVIFNGGRTPANGWVSPVVDGYTPNACGDACVYDVEAAKKLLAEAGSDVPKSITIAYNADGAHQPWVDAVCNSIKNALALDCQGKAYPTFGPLRTDVTEKKMKSFIRTGWQMDYPSIENFLAPLYVKGAGSNDGAYSNPAFDAKLKEAGSAAPDQANALYQQAEAMLKDQMPAIPLWYYQTQAAYSENVDNVNYTPFGEIDLTSITVK